jgi:hypothetical protein
VKSALQANLLMQFRTGNLLYDALIGMAIASVTMYIFTLQQPVIAMVKAAWAYARSTSRGNTVSFSAQIRPNKMNGDLVSETFVALTDWLICQIKSESLCGVTALKEVPLRKQIHIISDSSDESSWSKSMLLLDQDKAVCYYHKPSNEENSGDDYHTIRITHSSETIETEDSTFGQKQKVSNQLHCIALQSPTLSMKQLTEFVDGITDAYTAKQRNANSGELNYFLYRSLSSSDDDRTTRGVPEYDTYKWCTTKRYEHVKSCHADTIERRVNHFLTNREWFSAQGKPYSLTFLLHGPPGCGKTSIIKAVANATKRHIKEIPLPRVHSRLALMEVFHATHKANGTEIRPDNCIYVFEEFDKLGKLVNKTPGDTSSHSSDDLEETDLTPSSSQQSLSEQWVAAATVASIASTMADGGRGGEKPSCARMPEPPLQLGDILNVMDGLLEHDGTITFYTANDITHLHDAITRPGRVDMILHFDYATVEQCCDIVSSAFTDVEERCLDALRAQKDALDKKLSPAKVEEICTSCETAEEAVAHILAL